MTTVDSRKDLPPAEAMPPPNPRVRNAVIDRIVTHSTHARNVLKSADTADLILADLQHLGYGEVWRYSLPAVRALQRLASTDRIVQVTTGDEARDMLAEVRARAELARVTLAGMGIPWRRRTT